MKSDNEGEGKAKGAAEVRYAYLVFRSMDSVGFVERAYEDHGCCKRCCIMGPCGKCCCNQKREEMEKKHLFKAWPVVEVACEPDNIKWENLGYSKNARRCRICFNWMIALILLIMSFVGIVILKIEVKKLKEKYNSDGLVCPKNIVKLK